VRSDPRLFVADDLFAQNVVNLTQQQNHYIVNVMRGQLGQSVTLFNGRHGEWQAQIIAVNKKFASLQVTHLLRDQIVTPEIHLYFSPLKQEPLRFLIEKATELNVTHLHPLKTARTHTTHYNAEKLQRITIEAAEQCERLTLPQWHDILTFDQLIQCISSVKQAYIADERRPSINITQHDVSLPLHLIIGPEGGFTPDEFEAFSQLPHVKFIKLSSSILRAETAALTMLAQIQQYL